MKKLIFTLIISVFLSHFVQAQIYVNGVNINDLESVTYCEIMVIQRFRKVEISVNYGQRYSIWNAKKYTVTQANKEKIYFNSLTDALNFFAKYDWEYAESITEVFKGNTSEKTYILKRKKTNP